MGNTKLNTVETDEVLSDTDVNTVNKIKDLDSVKVAVIYAIEHDGKRYERGERLTLPRLQANYHIESGNCTIVK